MTDSLYVPLGDGRYRATGFTQGPWHPDHQHGGPPAALLAGALERDHPRPGLALAQFSMDILRPIPIGEVSVRSEVVRDGRRVRYVTAEVQAGGRLVARARGWLIRAAETADVASRSTAPPEPIPAESATRPSGSGPFGYFDALDWRFARGAFNTPGPVVAWLRLKVPVLPGEEPTPMQRVVAVTDSASGVSNELSFQTHMFSNVDLTVHVHRQPVGAWVRVDATSTIGPQGSGLCRSGLSDEAGEFGSAAQALFIAERTDAGG